MRTGSNDYGSNDVGIASLAPPHCTTCRCPCWTAMVNGARHRCGSGKGRSRRHSRRLVRRTGARTCLPWPIESVLSGGDWVPRPFPFDRLRASSEVERLAGGGRGQPFRRAALAQGPEPVIPPGIKIPISFLSVIGSESSAADVAVAVDLRHPDHGSPNSSPSRGSRGTISSKIMSLRSLSGSPNREYENRLVGTYVQKTLGTRL